MRTVELAKVMAVYSGKPGCCCGCRGKHTTASAHREANAARRGYAVSDEEVNDRIVKRHVTTINDAINAGLPVEWGSNYCCFDNGSRWIIAYFAPENTCRHCHTGYEASDDPICGHCGELADGEYSGADRPMFTPEGKLRTAIA